MSRNLHAIQTHDGVGIAAWCHEAESAVRGNVVIASAMAVPQAFYADFANFLAMQGFRVWTFDYRGIFESRHGPMRHCKTDISTWIGQDFDAVVRHGKQTAPQLPLYVIGHSLGGQVVPLLPSIGLIDGLITIATGSGSMRHNQPDVRRRAPLMWYLFAPLLCPLFGHFPGRRIGVIGDLPTGVMFQWRRWCLTPDYLLSGEPGAREAYARADLPVLGMMFGDDELLLASGSRMLHEAYGSARVDYREINPAQYGLKRVGHFGFFKASQGQVLWPVVADWMNRL